MRDSVFQRRAIARKGARKGVKINIPDGLHDRILAVKARLATVAPSLVFNAAGIAREALEDAIRRAHGELDQIERERPVLEPATCSSQDAALEQARSQ
ncbi:MAG: hypothetical protein ACOY4D_05760 [Pseudomonadota bacterium]